MAKIRNFKADLYSGTVGPFIEVKGEVNCGRLEVQPTIEEKVPSGINQTIFQVVAYPASDQTPETFRDAKNSFNVDAGHGYEDVEIFDPQGNSLETIKITKH